MSKIANVRRAAGFTTIELIIAIQLSFFVISLAYIGYLFSTKLFNKWQEKIRFETNLAQVSSALSRSLDQLQAINTGTETGISGTKITGDSLQIRLNEHAWINHRLAGDAAYPLQSGQIEYLFPDPDDPATLTGDVDAPGKNFNIVQAVRIRLKYLKNGRQYSLEILTRLPNLKRDILNPVDDQRNTTDQ